ncbi:MULTISPECIES: riboflavin biosynthesis protein RibF [Terrabacteria group]|uniref:riboflavin biosynthesis protein RibF n=1 Tax=Bacillati TaxID=1783272 RepID=UPI001C6E6762|nr:MULTISPECIES: riboflavin biosynthesis protein RibF [Terrabacteria group]MBW9211872.1 riboflavin biosynthesis protein RibF [Trueperella sp. zg.1013]
MKKDFLTLAKETNIEEKLVACIGYFDGIHVGHQALIQKTIELAKKEKAIPTMISFEPDPWLVIKDMKEIKHITTMEDRMSLVEELGIERFILLDFTKEMASLEPEVFIEQVLGKLHLKGLVCGFDFHFGKQGKGDYSFLQKHCSYPIFQIDKIEDEKGKISSTRISQAIMNGQMEEANRLLGRDYSCQGKVIHGLRKGHQLNFPTANIAYSDELILAKKGVYGGYVFIHGEKKLCMMNLGHNPSIQYQNRLSLEVHILDFDEDLYGQKLRVYWLGFIRDEKYFSSPEELMDQLMKDQIEVIRKWG